MTRIREEEEEEAVTDRKARYLLQIEILAYTTCIRLPVRGVPIGISP